MSTINRAPFTLVPASGPFDDPALFLRISQDERAALFDCGTLQGLKTVDLHRVRWLFLTHSHIDHLIGFDHLIRARLFSSLPLTVYGPAGTIEIISHRLQGYAWNLTSGSPFQVRVFELGENRRLTGMQLICEQRFLPCPVDDNAKEDAPREDGSVKINSILQLSSHPVEHGVPCLCFRLDYQSLPKFSLAKAQQLELSTGPWVKRLTLGEELTLTVQGVSRSSRWLSQRLLEPPSAYSIGYLSDTVLTEFLLKSLSKFFMGVTVLCSEAAYLKEDLNLALANMHMTAPQVAELAKDCKALELRLFHLSKRYAKSGWERHLLEARQVFPPTRLLIETS